MRAGKSIDAATCLSVTAQIAILLFWSRWAHAQHLPLERGLSWIVFVALAGIATTLVHECGHVLFAWCFEIGLLSFSVGPVQLEKWKGKWRLRLYAAGLLTPGGPVTALSTNSRRSRWEEIVLIAAGPTANFVVGAAAIWAVLHDDWASYQETWQFVAITGSFCLMAGVMNLLPFFSPDGAYSDGARIRQTLTGTSLDEPAPLSDSPEAEPSADPTAITYAAPKIIPTLTAVISAEPKIIPKSTAILDATPTIIPTTIASAAPRMIPTPAAITSAVPKIIPTPTAIISAAPKIVPTPSAIVPAAKAIINPKVAPPVSSTTGIVTDESMSAALARIAGPAQPSRESASSAPDPIARVPAPPPALTLAASAAPEPPAQIAAAEPPAQIASLPKPTAPPAFDPLARIARAPDPIEPPAALPHPKPAPDALTRFVAVPLSGEIAPDPVPAPPVMMPPVAKPVAAPARPAVDSLTRIAALPSSESTAPAVVDPLDRILLRQPDSLFPRATQTVTRIPAAALISVPARPTTLAQMPPAPVGTPLGGPATKAPAVPAAFARRPRPAPTPLSDPFVNIAANASPAPDAVPAEPDPVLP